MSLWGVDIFLVSGESCIRLWRRKRHGFNAEIKGERLESKKAQKVGFRHRHRSFSPDASKPLLYRMEESYTLCILSQSITDTTASLFYSVSRQEEKPKISSGDLRHGLRHTLTHTHTQSREASACLCAETTRRGHPYHCVMIIKGEGCFFSRMENR